ncbi:hypothetical protein QWZ10_05190 [Paracoccus cavernae]|uniref:Uncharacterized protein n=1 Tax=Paracoccus cavernae TaxID=1571207 RepID=A0ABT8D6D2_9RHOB|nr:hypothetical protein [Paracoccus cavernae]
MYRVLTAGCALALGFTLSGFAGLSVEAAPVPRRNPMPRNSRPCATEPRSVPMMPNGWTRSI